MLEPSGFPPDRATVGGGYVDDQHRQALRSDREVLEPAAARLRSGAIQAGYAGFRHQHVAFGLALILDELARHLPDLDDAVRGQALRSCRRLLGPPSASSRGC